MPNVISLTSVLLKNSKEINEKWVQEQIANKPEILGLGDLILRDRERIQPNAGRLDLLLTDPETLKRYECELQLGTTDETHIIRTIEYWDIERKRYPQYNHTAVLIAENVDKRFLNVIHLFNGFIPLIVLKLTAYEFNGGIALTFTKVLDEVNLGLVDEDEPVATPTDRSYWETRSTKKMLSFTDQLFTLVKEKNSDVELKYNKFYIGLANAGIATNYCSFEPRKESVTMTFKISQTAELTDRLDKSDFDVLNYDQQWGQYRIKMKSMPSGEEKDLLIELIQMAMDEYRK